MTQNERILRHLKDYGSLTSLEAMSEYGVMRAASRVNELREGGYPIKSEWLSGKNRYGERTRYVRYTLESGGDHGQ